MIRPRSLSRTLLLLVVAATAVALAACATPRERTEPAWESQEQPASQVREEVREQPASALAELTSDSAREAEAAAASESFQMDGSGDAEATHVLKTGHYECGVTLEDNLEGDRPGAFRIQFMGPDPIAAPLVSRSEPSWNSNVEFALIGREGSETGQVVVRVKAAPLGRWTLQCDKQTAALSATRSVTVINVGAVTESGKAIPGQSALHGTGSSPGALLLQADFKYDCSMSVERNVDETGVAAQFSVKIGDELVADVTLADWRGEHQYFREAEETESTVNATETTRNLGKNSVSVNVIAGEYGEWSVVCTPKLS